MSAAEDLRRQALALPADDRRALAEELAASLAPEPFTAEELATFRADAAAMADGSDPGVSWATLRAQLADDRQRRPGS